MAHNVNADLAGWSHQDAANRRTSCYPATRPLICELVMKRCTKCGEVKALDQFGRHRGRKDGRSQCKACTRAHEQTPERRAERRAANAAYYAAHRAEIRAESAAYYAEHRAESAVYRAEHRAERRAVSAAYRQSQLGKECDRRCRQKHRALKKSNTPPERMLTTAQWDAILAASKGRCYWCKEKCKPVTMDHVLPLSRGGQHVAENVVVACLKCNKKKNARIVTLF